MRKKILHIVLIGFCLTTSSKSFSQLDQTLQQIGYLLDDALFFSDRYITPANDAAVYQSSSTWMNTAKKRKFGQVTLGLHGNLFVVPNRDRSFNVSNADFKLFTIENNISATIPTALGNNSDVHFIGNISGSPLRISAPKGINQETVFYPYLQGSITLWKGTEVIGKYSTKVKLKKGNYQVYGVGIKHNISQYIPYLEKKNLYLAGLVSYSNEKTAFDFLDIQTPYGSLGLNQITGYVNTYQFQMSASKQFKKFELMISSITNNSNFKYKITGPKGEIESFIPFQDIVNSRLKEIERNKINTIGEISGRYQINKIFVQSTFAFGKFVNTNLSIQYEF